MALFTLSLHPSSLASNTGLRFELNLSLLELGPGLIWAAIFQSHSIHKYDWIWIKTNTEPHLLSDENLNYLKINTLIGKLNTNIQEFGLLNIINAYKIKELQQIIVYVLCSYQRR